MTGIIVMPVNTSRVRCNRWSTASLEGDKLDERHEQYGRQEILQDFDEILKF